MTYVTEKNKELIDHDELVPHPEPDMENVFLNGTGRNMYVESLFLDAVHNQRMPD